MKNYIAISCLVSLIGCNLLGVDETTTQLTQNQSCR